IEFLIQNKIIVIPQTESEENSTQQIPSWIKNNAGWWADDQIDDNTFVQGLQFLIEKGIIQV
ncbi:MAG: peptidase, partial [Nitrosopumilaceae archaeon]|nr:peptidase [Nitrosopumilaceae archaeon]